MNLPTEPDLKLGSILYSRSMPFQGLTISPAEAIVILIHLSRRRGKTPFDRSTQKYLNKEVISLIGLEKYRNTRRTWRRVISTNMEVLL